MQSTRDEDLCVASDLDEEVRIADELWREMRGIGLSWEGAAFSRFAFSTTSRTFLMTRRVPGFGRGGSLIP